MNSTRSKVAVITLLCLGLIVLLLWMPHLPASSKPGSGAVSADSLKMLKAISLVNSDNPMEGIQMLLQMVKDDSTNVQAHMYLGQFAVQSGQLPKALDRFNKVLRLKPEMADAHFEKGYVLMQMDSMAQALASFQQGLKNEPDNLNGLFFSAQCCEGLERWPEARDYYLKVIELNTDSVVEQKVKEFIENIDKKLNP